MKLLLFTHREDIDGIGCAILASTSNSEFDLILCKTFELDKKLNEKFSKGIKTKYDKVIITDLCPGHELLNIIDNDEELRKKFQVLDHHKTKEQNNAYSFVTIICEQDGRKESGTSLFYEYLKSKSLIQKNDTLDEFVELTRLYDTLEWQKVNNELARKLHIIFETQGIDYYMKMIKSLLSKNRGIILSKKDECIVNIYEKDFQNFLEQINQTMIIKNINIDENKYKVGYIRSPYKYRNDIQDAIKKNNNENIDAIGMIIEDRDTVSYRSIKDVDVSIIAEYFGGSGHKAAASHPKDNILFHNKINNKL